MVVKSENNWFVYSISYQYYLLLLENSENCTIYMIYITYLINWLNVTNSTGLKELSTTFALCKPLTSMNDYHHLLGWIRNAFTYLAMMDYPYPTSFMGNLPGYPVKVRQCDDELFVL